MKKVFLILCFLLSSIAFGETKPTIEGGNGNIKITADEVLVNQVRLLETIQDLKNEIKALNEKIDANKIEVDQKITSLTNSNETSVVDLDKKISENKTSLQTNSFDIGKLGEDYLALEKNLTGMGSDFNLFKHSMVQYFSDFVEDIIGAGFVRIKSGTFQMGNTGAHAGYSHEKPVHTVTLTKDFYIMKTPVTQLMWYKVMGTNPSYHKSDSHCPGEKITLNGIDLCPNNPVERVSWNDSQSFISKLNQQSGTTKYRFCTEAEWEYSAKAGTSTDYSFGNGDTDLGNYAWYSSNSGSHTHPVAKKLPNPWGLYDMHGNVWEWVNDRWQSPYPSSSSQTNPVGPSSGSYRVLRGGSWAHSAVYLRSSNRASITPTAVNDSYGFRPCRTL